MSGDHDWNESLFGCFDDWRSCAYGFCCTPCLFGTNAKKISDHNCVGMCCLYSILGGCYLCWLPHWYERKALREKYNLREDPSCGDIVTTLCCSPCALCQEARELNTRERSGITYHGNSPTIVSQPASAPRGAYPDSHRV